MNHSLLSSQYLPLFRSNCMPLGQVPLLTADINYEESLKNGQTYLQEEICPQGTVLADLSNEYG
jgi:hypothetical protein